MLGPAIDHKYPDIGQAAILVFRVFAMLLLTSFAIHLFLAFEGERHFEAVVLGLVNSLIFCLVLFPAILRTGVSPSEVLAVRRVGIQAIGAMTLTILGIIIPTNSLTNFLMSLLPTEHSLSPAMDDMLRPGANPYGIVFLLVLVAPITEETFFRGLLLHGFLQRYRARKAILVSALMFSLLHMNLVQLPVTFVIGLLLGWWRSRMPSLWPCLWGHAVNNAIAALTMIKGAEIADYLKLEAESPTTKQLIVSLAISAVLASIGVMWSIYLFRRQPKPEAAPAAAAPAKPETWRMEDFLIDPAGHASSNRAPELYRPSPPPAAPPTDRGPE